MTQPQESRQNYLEIPNEIQAQWRVYLYRICLLLAAIGTVAEVVIYLIDSSTRTLFLPLQEYRFRFIYIPSGLNILAVCLTYRAIRSKKLSNTAKNRWSCALILFLCVNTQMTHYVYGPLLALPCLAIFVSVLFADRRLTLCVTLISCASICAACLVGSLELRRDDPLLLSDMGLAILLMIVSYIGAQLLIRFVRLQINFILASAKQRDELLQKLQIDNLMGIFNRSKMDSVINALIAEPGAADGGLYLLMLDLDDFKAINDTYGHPCGDQVLLRLADLIRQFGSKDVIPCRYGGEEIVIILKHSSDEDAHRFADVLLQRFREQRYSFAPEKSLSFSCGVAVYRYGLTRGAWIKQADDNLYQAKALGKNRVYPEA